MHQYNVGAPYERITIRTVGSFSHSNQGNWYLMIVMDCFTKWPEAYTIPNHKVSMVA
jgi:hypothetical protein